MKFDTEIIDTATWVGNRLTWCIWGDSPLKSTNVLNLRYEGDDLMVTSLKIANVEFMVHNELPLSSFQNNLALYHFLQPGNFLSIQIRKEPGKRAKIWFELEQ